MALGSSGAPQVVLAPRPVPRPSAPRLTLSSFLVPGSSFHPQPVPSAHPSSPAPSFNPRPLLQLVPRSHCSLPARPHLTPVPSTRPSTPASPSGRPLSISRGLHRPREATSGAGAGGGEVAGPRQGGREGAGPGRRGGKLFAAAGARAGRGAPSHPR